MLGTSVPTVPMARIRERGALPSSAVVRPYGRRGIKSKRLQRVLGTAGARLLGAGVLFLLWHAASGQAGARQLATESLVLTGDERLLVEEARSHEPEGCFGAADLKWAPLSPRSTGGTYRLWRAEGEALAPSDVFRVRNKGEEAKALGLLLPSGLLATTRRPGSAVAPIGRLRVVDAESERGIPNARLLIPGGSESSSACLLVTDASGSVARALPPWPFAGVVVAAEGYVGGSAVLGPDGVVRLERAHAVVGEVTGSEARENLTVLAVPRSRPYVAGSAPLAVATTAPDGSFRLRGVPSSTRSILLVVFQNGALVGLSRYDYSSARASVPLELGSVTTRSRSADVVLRLEGLVDGTPLSDFALGSLAELRLQRWGSENEWSGELPAGWYTTVGQTQGFSFLLRGGEHRDLGAIESAETLTVEVLGLDGREGLLVWYENRCEAPQAATDAVSGAGASRSVMAGSLPVVLWLPGGCRRVYGDVTAPGMLTAEFEWSLGAARHVRARLREGFLLQGTVWDRAERPLAHAVVRAFREETALQGKAVVSAAMGVSAEDGSFEMVVAEEGPYLLATFLPDHFAPLHRVVVGSEREARETVVEAREGASLFGVVHSRGEVPVPNAEVRWRVVDGDGQMGAGQGTMQSTLTNDRGEFSFPSWHGPRRSFFSALPAATVEFSVTPRLGETETLTRELEKGRNEVEIVIETGATIEVELVGGPPEIPTEIRLSRPRVVDLPGLLSGIEPDRESRTVVTAGGAFMFDNVGAGEVSLLAVAEGYSSPELQLSLGVNDFRRVVLEMFPDTSTIEGRIKGIESRPNSQVRAIASTGSLRTADLGADGRFAFTDLAVGDWRILLEERGRLLTLADDVSFSVPGSYVYLDLDTGRLPVVSFLSERSGGALILEEAGVIASVPVQADGTAIIHAPRAGRYTLRYVAGDGASVYETEITVVGGQQSVTLESLQRARPPR